jgi:hypothetical protein
MPISHTAPRLGSVERLEPRHLMAALAAVDASETNVPPLELPASVAGSLFFDGNADGVRQAFEAGVAGAAIELLDLAGRTVAATVTGAGGEYDVPALAPGAYTIRASVSSAALDQSSGDPRMEQSPWRRYVVLSAGDLLTDFDLAVPEPAPAPQAQSATTAGAAASPLAGYRPTPTVQWPRPTPALDPEPAPPHTVAPVWAAGALATRQDEPVFGGSSRRLDARPRALDAGELRADDDLSPEAGLSATASSPERDRIAAIRRRHAARDRAFEVNGRQQGTIGAQETPSGQAPGEVAPQAEPRSGSTPRIAARPAA